MIKILQLGSVGRNIRHKRKSILININFVFVEQRFSEYLNKELNSSLHSVKEIPFDSILISRLLICCIVSHPFIKICSPKTKAL